MKAIDTNVLAYSCDQKEPLKQAKALSLLAHLSASPSECQLIWQVACEFLGFLRKWEAAGRISPADVRANFDDIFNTFPLFLPVSKMIELSFDLRSRHSVSHWDSLLLAACIEAGVDTLYTEDLSDGANYDGVTVVNPFV